MNPEFDKYAGDYEQLLKDPLRDKFSGGSEFFHQRKFILLQEFFQARNRDTTKMSWLDVGCGKGELLRLGKDSFGPVAGCDFSAAMLSVCRDLDVTPQTSARELPYPDAAFDLVTAVCVYHHVERAIRPILTAEIKRVLRPGGIFCMIEHNPFNPATQWIVRRTPVDDDADLLTAGRARKLAAAAIMPVISTEYFLYLPKTLYWKYRKLERALRDVPLGGQYALYCDRD